MRILPCVLACLCLQRWARFGVWCRHGGVVAKGWVIAKLLRGCCCRVVGSMALVVVVTVGIEAPRAQLFCLLSPYGRQVSPRGSTALDHAHLPIPPASSQVPSSASCCIASCYIHVTIKSSTVFLRQVSPSGTVLARCSSDSSAVTCSIIVASASACLLLLPHAKHCIAPVIPVAKSSSPSQTIANTIRPMVLLSAYSRRQGHPLFLLHRLIPTHSVGQELHCILSKVLRLAQAVVSPRALSSVVAVSL